MTALSPQSEALLDRFRRQPGVTAEQANNLEAAIHASPMLVERFNDAVAQAHLRSLVPLAHANAGGEYQRDSKTIALPLADLSTTPTPGTLRRYHEGNMIFVLAHELEHAFNSPDKTRAETTLLHEAERKAKSPPPHDYTAEVGRMIGFNRRDEAKAEIAGWNAIVSAVKVTIPNPTPSDIYSRSPGRMVDFVDFNRSTGTYSAKPNLTLDPGLTLDPARHANVEAMGQNYFDKPARQSRLGPHGHSDYANHYGAYAVSVAAYAERNGAQRGQPIVLDLAKLRLNEKLLEENGIDLGARGRTMAYVDVGTSPAAPGRFDHTRDSHVHVPVTAPRTVAPPRSPDDPSHPDHAMLQQIREGVRRIDEGIGKPYDDMSERISRSLLAASKDNREAYPHATDHSLSANALSRVDHVVMGDNGNVFAVEGRLDDAAHKRTHVSTQQAIQTPVEHSDQKLQAAHLAIAQEQHMAEQQTMSRNMGEPSRGAIGH